MAQRRNFLAELGRRHVWRAAALYVGAVWAFGQGLSQFSPALGLPDYATRWFLIAAVVGFPLWLAFAWFYEFTPQGIRRESEVAEDAPSRHSTARKLDFAIIGVLIVAVALLASGYFIRRPVPIAATKAGISGASFNPPADTLVVLPFANLNGDPKQQYFSDGITEELTNALGQNTGLRVIAWDTASRYRDSRQSASDIAKSLDVANVLTGKILRQGNEVRVIVELVNAATGYQTWSSHYDDSLSNIFKVQDTITASIADALKVKFATVNTQRSVNPQAYELVLKARALMETGRTAAPFEQARALFEQAIALDQSYADAHAGLARAWFDLTQYSTLPLKDALPKVRAEANQAIILDPHNVRALVSLGIADESEGKLAQAMAEFERALAIDPSDVVAHIDYGNVLPLRQAAEQEQEAVRLDPGNAAAQNNLAEDYLDVGEYAKALPPTLAGMKLAPHSADNAMSLALIYSLLHRPGEAVTAFELAQPDTPLAKAMVAAGRLTYQSVLDPKLHAQALAAVAALRQRADLDPYSMGDLLQLYLVLGQNDTALALLPQTCAAAPVGCNDLSVNPLYLPLRGKPGFQALVKQYDTISQPPAPAASAAPSSP